MLGSRRQPTLGAPVESRPKNIGTTEKTQGRPKRRNVMQWRPSCGLAQAQELEGAWKLTARKLPNGTTLTPPAVQGAIMCQSGVWTRVVFWHTPEGKPASFSAVSTYKFAPAEYTETLLFSASDDGSGKPTIYSPTPQTKAPRSRARVADWHSNCRSIRRQLSLKLIK